MFDAMHSFSFNRKATVPESGNRLLTISVKHNGDWSGLALITVVSAPVNVPNTDQWYWALSPTERDRITEEVTVDADVLLNGDVHIKGSLTLLPLVIGPIIAQSVVRYLHDRAMSAVEDLWLPKASK